jgi:hypothetical protein
MGGEEGGECKWGSRCGRWSVISDRVISNQWSVVSRRSGGFAVLGRQRAAAVQGGMESGEAGDFLGLIGVKGG